MKNNVEVSKRNKKLVIMGVIILIVVLLILSKTGVVPLEFQSIEINHKILFVHMEGTLSFDQNEIISFIIRKALYFVFKEIFWMLVF